MAFTEPQKLKIVRLLGWPFNTIVEGTMSYSKTIADKLLSVPSDAEATVLALVTRIENLDTGLTAAVGQSGVKKIDDIEFFGASDGGTKMEELRKERKRLIKELAAMMDIAMGPGASGGSMGNVIV